MEKKSIGENILHFLGVGIVIVILEKFPESHFWLPLGLFILFLPMFIFAYKDDIKIIHILILTLSIIGVEFILDKYPELINISDNINSQSELYTSLIIFSTLIYFFISFIFHSFVKSHWINLVSTTYLIMIYRALYNFSNFMSLKHTFVSFIAMLVGLIVGVGLFLYLGYLLGNIVRKKFNV